MFCPRAILRDDCAPAGAHRRGANSLTCGGGDFRWKRLWRGNAVQSDDKQDDYSYDAYNQHDR